MDRRRAPSAESQELGRENMYDSIFIGQDVHRAMILVAVAEGEPGGEDHRWGTSLNARIIFAN